MNGYVAVAIDGPAGAGKSTLAKAAAKELGYTYADTGAIYRTVGLACLRRGIDPLDTKAVSALLPELQIGFSHDETGSQHMVLNGEDVESLIRTPPVSEAASRVSSLGEVRSYLLAMQRSLAETENVIMDGRDIGTVILPRAEVKIYLTASAESRAHRRYLELCAKGETCTESEVLEDICARDHRDMTREVAPLRRAEDAVLLDTSCMCLEESLQELLRIIRTGADLT